MAKEYPDIARLCEAMHRSRLALRKPREERLYMAKLAVGRHYSLEGATQEQPCNMLALYQSIVGRKLIANDPRVMLSTFNKQARPIVSAMEAWANKEVQKIDLAGTLQRTVIDALYSVGICKVSLATPADAAALSWNLRAGQPFAQRVDLDDFVFDTHARDFSEAAFIGHRYRVPLRVVRESKIYSKSRRNLTASDDPLFNMEGDERISVIGRTYLSGQEEFEDMVDLWEVYLPRHRLVVTLRDDQLCGAGWDQSSPIHGKALRIQRWIGPDCGPYHILGFTPVPGSCMPAGPLQNLLPLHEAINKILRKLIAQAFRQKEQLFVNGAASEDGSRVLEGNDGEGVKVDNTDGIKVFTWGGPNANNFQLFTALKELFSWLSGNLEIMGGLGPQSKTATQDELLNANSSATLSDMQQKTQKTTASVIRALCWYWHHDPISVRASHFQVPGMPELSARRIIRPQDRHQIPFEEMDIEVDPYSMQYSSPQQRGQALDQMMMNILIPTQQMLQQQGIYIDMNSWLTKRSKFLDQPDLTDILTIGDPPAEGETPGGPSGTTPPETTRNYVRRSVGGATQPGKDLDALNRMRQSPQQNGTPQTNGTGIQ